MARRKKKADAPDKNSTIEAPPEKARALSDIPPATILVIDIGGTKIKMLATAQTEPRKFASGKTLTPARMVDLVKEKAADWDYEAVSIGFPGLVGSHGPRSEPGNLGRGWVGFNFAAALEKPVRIINDAAMQAVGSYEGGRMLFLGLGTGLGSTLIAEHVIVPLELGNLLYKEGQTYAETVGRRGLARLGKDAWRSVVKEMVGIFQKAFTADYVVLGGGNAKVLKTDLPAGTRLGSNLTAFRGGFRLWSLDDIPTLSAEGAETPTPVAPTEWRVL